MDSQDRGCPRRIHSLGTVEAGRASRSARRYWGRHPAGAYRHHAADGGVVLDLFGLQLIYQ